MQGYHIDKSLKDAAKSSTGSTVGQSIACGEGFYKSSFSGGANCVAVAKKSGGKVLVRDTKDPLKQTITFTRSEWKAFVDGVKNNEFDV